MKTRSSRNNINKLAESGITRGCNPPSNDRYCPDSSVTRGQMAAFLVRAFGYADAGGSDLFVDDDTSIFENDIDKLGTAGVTRGCNPPTNDRFCPSDKVLRDQTASFLDPRLDPRSSTTKTNYDDHEFHHNKDPTELRPIISHGLHTAPPPDLEPSMWSRFPPRGQAGRKNRLRRQCICR